MGRSRVSPLARRNEPTTTTMSSSNGIMPWIVMGLSMGMGYFWMESLLSWYSTNSTCKKKKANPLHEQLIRHVRQMGSLLSLSDATAWVLRSWTLPLGGLYRDVFWGVFVAVLPQIPDDGDDDNKENAARVLGRATTPRISNTSQHAEDAFLTLPAQLNPTRLAANKPSSNNNNKKERYLEMMLHNVSHTDLVLGLEVVNRTSSSSSFESMCLGRPRFSAFDMYCRKLLQALDASTEEAEIVLVPQYQRSQSDARYTIQPSDRPHVSTGFCWKKSISDKTNPRVIPLTEALADLRVRGKDMAKKIDPYLNDHNNNKQQQQRSTSPVDMTASWNMVPPAEEQMTIAPPEKSDILVELKAVFFPLLATLLPRWHSQIAQKYNRQHTEAITKVLVLVTGVGTPRNWTHSITGNSTQALADLMELFLAKIYPEINVVKIHSDTNIFRYDDNILFVQQQLMPTVNAYRDAHATQAPYPHEVDVVPPTTKSSSAPFDVDWKKSFAVTLSFADGSPARTHAIHTALRIFRPTYFHIWQLKTFWHERKIVDDDVEVHSFEEMETSPALESSEIQGDLAQVVHEMKAFKEEMTETLLGKKDSSDIHSFWLRKTHKPVLAVLLVQTAGGPPVLYRGTNMEVSMPTGSLCAERNVIGTALANNPKLKREDLKCMAVLAVPQPPKTATATSGGLPPRPPRSASGDSEVCGSCKSTDESNNAATTTTTTTTATMTGHQMRKESFDEREEDWMLSYASKPEKNGKSEIAVEAAEIRPPQEAPSTPMRQISLFPSESSNSLVDMIKQIPTGSPPQGKASSSSSVAGGKEKRTVIVRSNNHDVDLNPLRPCGACHEWLKKIAECNPYFQIMTFTDADCNGVYLTPCQE